MCWKHLYRLFTPSQLKPLPRLGFKQNQQNVTKTFSGLLCDVFIGKSWPKTLANITEKYLEVAIEKTIFTNNWRLLAFVAYHYEKALCLDNCAEKILPSESVNCIWAVPLVTTPFFSGTINTIFTFEGAILFYFSRSSFSPREMVFANKTNVVRKEARKSNL